MSRVTVEYGSGVGVLICLLVSVMAASFAVGWAQDFGLSPEAQEAVKQLDAKDPYVRRMAFMRLEALREVATGPAVRQYLESRNPDTRAFSVRALAAIEGAKAIPALLERLRKDRIARVRVAVLLALEPLHDPDAMPVLIERLRDRNPEVRMAAIDVVSRLDHPQARQAILKRLRRERHRDVQRVLDDAMKRLGGVK